MDAVRVRAVKFPVDIVDKDENTWADSVTSDEHIVTRADEMVLDPDDEGSKSICCSRDGNWHGFVTREECFQTPSTY